MSTYVIGVDINMNSDYTMYCISKYPGKVRATLNNIFNLPTIPKVIYCGDDERVMRKYKYKGALIKEGIE